MNISITCSSLKYISKNYEVISNVSEWIYFELTKFNYKESKLIKSLDKKDFEIIKILIEFNKNIDLPSIFLAKYCICNENYFDIVKLLMNNGANHNTALMWASYYGRADIVKLLIDNGADIHIQNDLSLTYADINNHIDVVRLLIDNGANKDLVKHTKLN